MHYLNEGGRKMVIYINTETNEIFGYGKIVPEEDSIHYVSDTCIWLKDAEIDIPYQEGKRTRMYLNEDQTIRYEFTEDDAENHEDANINPTLPPIDEGKAGS